MSGNNHVFVDEAKRRGYLLGGCRAACLRAIVEDAAQRGDAMLVLEQDDSLVSWDNQHLIEFTRAAGCRETLRYEHRRAASELALASPDAIAWC